MAKLNSPFQRFVIGLTGGIGSGKSTVTAQFQQLGITVVDADEVARQVVQPGTACLAAIAAHFGSSILLNTGELNRAALRARIFAKPEDKHWLEQLLHPAIRSELLAQVAASKSPYTMLAAPLLFENGLARLVHRVLLVDVTEQTQLARTCARDNNSEQQVKAIMAAQWSRAQRLALTDDIIDNNGAPEALIAQINRLHQFYLELSRKIIDKEQ